MVSFYDPIDKTEQKHVEQMLRSGGIEYCLDDASAPLPGTSQILVAEEDVPEAERLLAGRG